MQLDAKERPACLLKNVPRLQQSERSGERPGKCPWRPQKTIYNALGTASANAFDTQKIVHACLSLRQRDFAADAPVSACYVRGQRQPLAKKCTCPLMSLGRAVSRLQPLQGAQCTWHWLLLELRQLRSLPVWARRQAYRLGIESSAQPINSRRLCSRPKSFFPGCEATAFGSSFSRVRK